MSLALIIAINIAAATTLSVILAILMLAPKRLRAHHHPGIARQRVGTPPAQSKDPNRETQPGRTRSGRPAEIITNS
jgi:hypothetical protein